MLKVGRIHIRFSFLLILSLFLLLEQLELSGKFLAAVLWHELGHLTVLWLRKQPIESIELSAFGIAIRKGEGSDTLFWELALYLAGPAANLLAAAFLLPWDKVAGLFHAVLAALNLLPARPMDGGNAVQRILEQIFSCETAEKLGHSLSVLVWLLLGLAGAFLVLRHSNPSLLVFTLILALQGRRSH